MADRDADSNRPTARQLLHWATGDREAEAEALSDAAGEDVSDEDAEQAVKEAHGDLGVEPGDDPDDSDVADPDDARRAAQDRR